MIALKKERRQGQKAMMKWQQGRRQMTKEVMLVVLEVIDLFWQFESHS